MDNVTYNTLVITACVLGCILFTLSAAEAGKQLSDFEYQKTVGLNGIRKLQTFINLRVHFNRMLLAFTFIFVSINVYLPLDIDVRIATNRAMILMMLLSFCVCAVLDWRDEYKQLKIVMNDNDRRSVQYLRLQCHRIDNDMQAVIGFADLMAVRAPNGEYVKDLSEAVNNLNASFKDLQREIRLRDPSYKTEKFEREAAL